jgi:3-oxoadipate enol-lactonase
MPFSKLDGGDIYYELHGPSMGSESLPIVVLRPFSRGPVGIQPFIDQLAQHHPVIKYDQRGIGKSPPYQLPGPVPMSGRASEVFELLESLQVAKAHVVCHSTGCGIGLSMIAAHPERVATITLVSPWTHADPHLLRTQNLRIAAARVLSPADYFRFNVSLLYPPDYRRAHEEGFAAMELATKDTSVDAAFIANGLIPILAFDSREITPLISCPTLIVVGNDDQLMPPWFGRSMAQDIRLSELVEFDGAGHMILETRPEELAAQMNAFINASDRH